MAGASQHGSSHKVSERVSQTGGMAVQAWRRVAGGVLLDSAADKPTKQGQVCSMEPRMVFGCLYIMW